LRLATCTVFDVMTGHACHRI